MRNTSKIILLTQLLLFFIPATSQAAPILLQPGDRAVFQFDFSPIDISSVGTIRYEWFTQAIPSIPSTEGVPIFEWSYGIFDELGEEPVLLRPSNLFSTTFLHFISNHSLRRTLFDDPISYIVLDFQGVSVLNADGFRELAQSMVSMELSASVFVGSDNSAIIAQVEGIGTVPSPSVLTLFAIALVSLGWSLRPRNA